MKHDGPDRGLAIKLLVGVGKLCALTTASEFSLSGAIISLTPSANRESGVQPHRSGRLCGGSAIRCPFGPRLVQG